MKIPVWLATLLVGGMLTICLAAGQWAIHANTRIDNNKASSEYVNERLINAETYMTSRVNNLEKTVDKLSDKIDNLKDEIHLLNEKRR